jgi:hypothetical protein
MTVVETPVEESPAEPWRAADPDDVAAAGGEVAADAPAAPAPPEELPPLAMRPLIAAFLASASAGLLVGGIFDSWTARVLGVVAASAGVVIAAMTLRSKRQGLLQVGAIPAIGVLATLTLVGAPGGPSNLPKLISQATEAGRLLQPPIPFDPGWRPIIFALLALVGYAAAWIGAGADRPLLGVVAPLFLVGLAAITQPKDGQVLAALFIFVPLFGAMGVLFAAAGPGGQKLDLRFELRRAAKALLAGIPAIALIIGLSSADFLFPKPTYDPNDKPQKPKALPLSSAVDRVLFSVKAPPGFTGPWRTGVLDVYDEEGFKLPGAAAARVQAIPSSGVIDPDHVAKADQVIEFTLGDLGNSPVLPSVPTAAVVVLPPSAPETKVDPRTGSLRLASGRAPYGLTYTVKVPAYPTAEALNAVGDAPPKGDFAQQLTAPKDQPPAVVRILREAPPSGFARLDYVRHQLLDKITAAGPRAPVPMDAKRVQDMIDGAKTGTPFEIVAAQVLLARWAGIPARIGFGFNGVNDEAGLSTVRPKNAAQWLEVWFDGYGWLPLLDVPPKAQTALDDPKDADEKVVASDDVAVDVFVPVGLPRPVPLYELVRARVLQLAPLLLVLLALRLAAPSVARALRRRKREQWAQLVGPHARIAVAYGELRDIAFDLNVGDQFATPIEYLARVEEDHDHGELAWLVSRAMYGDMIHTLTDADASMAEELSLSLQRRLRQAQPTQIRVVAALSQASLRSPFSDEIPNVTLPAPGEALRHRIDPIRARIRAQRRRRRLARESRGVRHDGRLVPVLRRLPLVSRLIPAAAAGASR